MQYTFSLGVRALALLCVAVLFVLGAHTTHAAQPTPFYYYPTYYYPGNSAFGLSHNPKHGVRPVYSAPQYTSQQAYIQQLLALIAQLQRQLDARDRNRDRDHRDSEIEITTKSATDIEDDEARLRGSVDFNDSNFAYVWFEYGEERNDLDEETPRIRRDDDEDEDFAVRLIRLDEDQRYYFRAVGEDDRGRIDRGGIRSFMTDEDDRRRDDDEPDADTHSATNIDEDSAEIRGSVDMNDFRNGVVFFVYGEDEDQVEDAEDDFDSYTDVDEDGDDLQKILVDSDLDGDETYRRTIRGLDDDTEYFFSICVEFEDEDDDETLICGDVEDFETDRD